LEYFDHYEDYIDPNQEVFGKDQIIENRKIPFIFLEEPESNLHPKWHSILVDLIVELKRNFGIQFIIETHSEYIIRKMQFLIAQKSNGLSSEDVVIYYVNNDKNVNVAEGENKIKRIDIDRFGGLTDNFGPGFFDESSNLKFELLKLNRHQSN
jgi:predicted ATPase